MDRPILFNGEMVRAILGGQKTQTRRVVKSPAKNMQESGAEVIRRREPGDKWYGDHVWSMRGGTGVWGDYTHERFLSMCPYGQPGDRLVVSALIDGFGGKYAAGSNGVIYSKARGDWRALSAHPGGKYPSVTLMDGGRKTTRNVHSLVCQAFYGPPPTSSHQVRHLDGDSRNSEPRNLCWGSQAENWIDRKCHGNGLEGEKHHASKLSDADRSHIRWAIERGLCSQRHAARSLGMTQSAIWQVMAGGDTSPVEQDIPEDRVPRITLEITGVRVERLQDISAEDARAEGCEKPNLPPEVRGVAGDFVADERTTFAILWNRINGPDSWDTNPWVWVIEFRRVD